ncbi:MAG: VWA domain-containing protein [Phycisphaerae bacterium]|nr:MAG: VWA domain-containing protein [Planctomycetota bacterium]KAB2943310.1 MAG: VWA domain-containing protein [Phycisphaerae bacterium]MBE7456636.1 VWA domain-containing protein [Planctomycetia bacterium]MCK6463984.1 VIT and VWA domain-containing protein [Phycisphaerae bacterium]MCL4718199.1 VWA domain-containing protein [Phycisphaerae bacterium]
MSQSWVFVRRVSAAIFVFAAFAPTVSGQTIIIDVDRPIPLPPPPDRPEPQPPDRPPPPPRPPQRDMRLVVRQLNVETRIIEGAAVTTIDQTFHNPHGFVVEGTYIFPLEEDVAISRFTMDVNGEEVEGKLLDVAEARRTYEQIVRSMRDPALLEYVGRRMIKASIFPINPQSDVRVRLSYNQMLEAKDGLVRYRYPLNVEKHLPAAIERFTFLATIQSRTPIKSVFSPTHDVAVSRGSDSRVSASLEGANVFPDRDLDLFYTLSEKNFGLSVLIFREPGEDGYFLVRISPDAVVKAEDVIPKDITFVLDTSGSMSEEDKMAQARAALKFCLSHLNERDAFNIITFAHEPRRFRDEMTPATPESRDAAKKFVDSVESVGGTNINDALLSALKDAPRKDPSRPYYIVFLTDGQPTVGVCKTDEILKNVREANESGSRLFVFGVGHDVNTQLLDLLAEQNRGTREYVEPGENLELALSSFYRRIADPVLSDLALSLGDLRVYDQFPPRLGDLFGGTELVVLGRYSGAGHKAVELTGQRRGVTERHVYETTFADDAREHDFLPRLWATRKVGYLLDEIRLHGEKNELKQSVITLAKKYGIVTPYTAYLVTEPGQFAMREAGRPELSRARSGSGSDQRRALQTLGYLDEDEGENDALSGDEAALRVLALRGLGYGEVSAENSAPAGTEKADRAPSRARAGSPQPAPASGALAVGQSKEAKALQESRISADEGRGGSGSADKKSKDADRIRTVGTRTFYRAGETWIDSTYDKKVETRKIEVFSEEYFKLVSEHKELAKCFALGERVIVVLGDVAYETTPPKETDADKEKTEKPEK